MADATFRPLIGITTALRRGQSAGSIDMLQAYTANVAALERAGAVPVLIPCTLSDDTLRALYERVDGLLLPGGGDIHAQYWGDALHPSADNVSLERDHTEISVARWAYADDKPLFGICRGHQIFNVAMGGSLVQDIPSMLETALRHDNFKPTPRNRIAHDVQIDADTRLAAAMGKTDAQVNSIHHQAIDRVGDHLRVTAKSPDGLVEGLEIPNRRFMLSVQWHPEDLAPDDDAMFGLFKALVDAARARATDHVS